jgi:hypothetical protein
MTKEQQAEWRWKLIDVMELDYEPDYATFRGVFERMLSELDAGRPLNTKSQALIDKVLANGRFDATI